jgi:uncharacterized repeat protein (TIGR03803 family)
MKTITLCAALVFLTCGSALGQTQYKVLWTFQGSPNDGARPAANLVMDSAGNLYGTTRLGGSGTMASGVVFELLPQGNGTWTETILHNFCTRVVNGFCADGAYPQAGLILDRAGNLYGTTEGGGSGFECFSGLGGCGTVFKLSPPSSPGGTWSERTLYGFCTVVSNGNCLDGNSPYGALTFDSSGNLYGTTSAGGSGTPKTQHGGGIVFELSHKSGKWTETVLYNFCSVSECLDGLAPMAGVTLDKAGNLYGTTESGGDPLGKGTLYQLSPSSNGWVETVLRNAMHSLAAGPLGTVSVDQLGNLYSTFSAGEQNASFGGVFRVGPHGGGTYFLFDGNNGDEPVAGVLLDQKNGSLYGTTSGAGNSVSTVFKMVAPAQLTVLYTFCSQPNCADGFGASAGVIEDNFGNLYGTTQYGGVNNLGVAYEVLQSVSKEETSRRAPACFHRRSGICGKD